MHDAAPPRMPQPYAGYGRSTEATFDRGLGVLPIIFIVSLIIPFIFTIGPIRLSPYRLVLISVFPILIYRFLSGASGRIRLADVFLLLLCMWATASFVVVHGVAIGLEAGGIFFIETMGAYLVARSFIRTERQFRAAIFLLFGLIILLIPFAILESLTGRNIILDIANIVGSHRDIRKAPRWGLERVQGPFEHPILFGVFCGGMIGLVYYAFLSRSKPVWGLAATGLVTFAALFSLSAGPLTGITSQYLLIIWDKVFWRMRRRWLALAAIVLVSWVFLEVASNRGPARLFISYFSFNEYSAYMRIHIWNFGTASILKNPFFGIGFNEWERPFWMSSSIDMFWIVFGVRHGFPAMLLTFLTFFAVYLPLVMKNGLTESQALCRTGLLVTLTGLFLTAWTVHLWNASYVFFLFLLGAGMWLLDAKSEQKTTQDGSSEKELRRLKYTRFP